MILDAEFTIKIKTKAIWNQTNVEEISDLTSDQKEILERFLEWVSIDHFEPVLRGQLALLEQAGILVEYSSRVQSPVEYSATTSKT